MRVAFDSRTRRPIRKFKLNQNSTFVKHRVFADEPIDPKVEHPNVDREFYVIQN